MDSPDVTDPFAAPPRDVRSAPPPSGPPIAAAPPPPPGVTTPPPVPDWTAGAPTSGPLLRPTAGLANYLLGATAGTVVVMWLVAFSSHSHVSLVNRWPGSRASAPLTPTEMLVPLVLLAGIASYVGFGLWMQTVAQNLKTLQRDFGVKPHAAWWSWLIPFASLVLPYRMMRDLASSARVRGAGWWWFLFLVAVVLNHLARTADGTTYATLETHGGMYVTFMYLSAGALTASWKALRRVVLDTTNGHAVQRQRPRPTP